VQTAIKQVGIAFGGLLKAFTPAIPGIVTAISDGITNIARAVARNPKALADFAIALFHIVGVALDVIGWLTQVADYLEMHFIPAFHDVVRFLDKWRHDIAANFLGFYHDTLAVFNRVWHDTFTAWDAMWRNTISRLVTGIHEANTLVAGWRNDIYGFLGQIVAFFEGLPHRTIAALSGWGTSLFNFAANALHLFLSGAQSVWHDVEGWFSGLPAAILHALGIHSPPDWAVSAGQHVMGGILQGLAHGGDVKAFFLGLVNDITGPLKSVWEQLASLGGGRFGKGVAQYTATAAGVLRMLGQPSSDLGTVLAQMQTESGGNPYAVNRSDINWQEGHPSVGLMQVIAGTFDAYAGPFRGVGPFEYGVSIDPLANIFAGINYAIHRYGAGWTSVLGHGHGYDQGGWLPPGLSLAANWTGAPELVIPGAAMRHRAGEPAQPKIVIQITPPGGGVLDQAFSNWLRKSVVVHGGGSVQVAFGSGNEGTVS
jgi:hypothetical protein